MRTRLKQVFAAVFALSFLLAHPLSAQQRSISFIRDAEVEETIRIISTPLFQQAGLPPSAIDVYLIDDDSLNAFVAGGLNMFLHTGFLMNTENVGQVMGVIAHETGHIEGGHIAARKAEIDALKNQLLASYVLGLGAAILSGNAGVGAAAASVSQETLLRGLLRYNRGQEASADQAAVRLVEGAGYSPQGLLEFLDVLHGQEALLSSNQDPYLRSHPLTQDRIDYLRDAIDNSPHRGKEFPADLVNRYDRMKAKLVGFIKPLEEVNRRYPAEDRSLAGRYARAIAHYRSGSLDRALAETEALIEENPQDPYFWELKGQMLYENGRIEDSIAPYQEAVRLAPESALLRIGLAAAILQQPGDQQLPAARDHLFHALQREGDNPSAWRYLAIAQGRMGDTAQAALSLAEAAWARGDAREAKDQALRAQKLLDAGSPGHLRAQDIERIADNELRRKANRQ